MGGEFGIYCLGIHISDHSIRRIWRAAIASTASITNLVIGITHTRGRVISLPELRSIRRCPPLSRGIR